VRAVTLVQTIEGAVEHHWRLFLDEAFDRALYLEALGFPAYECLERRETETEVLIRRRVTPTLEPLVASVLKEFAYLDEGRFDKQTRVWRSCTVPSVYSERVTTTALVRTEEMRGGCRRTVDLSVEVRAPGVGSFIENAVAKSLCKGWEQAARFMNERLRG
jgi:uncharacterized protein DUF2505